MSLKYEPSWQIEYVLRFVCSPLPGENSDGQVSDASVFFFFTLVTGPRRSLSMKLSDTRVYEPQIRARLPGENSDGQVPPAQIPVLTALYVPTLLLSLDLVDFRKQGVGAGGKLGRPGLRWPSG